MLRIIESHQFAQWLAKLRDIPAKAKILKQIQRIQLAEQYVGDWKPLGEGVVEVRIDSGPGYRLYTSITQKELLLLLTGGNKKTQSKDIEAAKRLQRKWRTGGSI